MNEITKEQQAKMLDYMDRVFLCYNSICDKQVYNAIRSLIESSGEKASGQGEGVVALIGGVVIESTLPRAARALPLGIGEDWASKYYPENVPAPSPAPLPAEVEEAMEELKDCESCDGNILRRQRAALAVIRAALKCREEMK